MGGKISNGLMIMTKIALILPSQISAFIFKEIIVYEFYK
jgi:hypothetical protein